MAKVVLGANAVQHLAPPVLKRRPVGTALHERRLDRLRDQQLIGELAHRAASRARRGAQSGEHRQGVDTHGPKPGDQLVLDRHQQRRFQRMIHLEAAAAAFVFQSDKEPAPRHPRMGELIKRLVPDPRAVDDQLTLGPSSNLLPADQGDRPHVVAQVVPHVVTPVLADGDISVPAPGGQLINEPAQDRGRGNSRHGLAEHPMLIHQASASLVGLPAPAGSPSVPPNGHPPVQIVGTPEKRQ